MSRRNVGKVKASRSGRVTDESQSGRQDLKAEIAARAARLIAEDGVQDLGVAKRKAARQLGVSAGALLPDDFAVDTALRSYQAIFQRDSQPDECRALRKIAVEAMRWLHHFSPRLVGAVLSGSANRFSHVELEIVADNAKQLEIFFLNEGIPFNTRICRSRLRQADTARNDISRYEISFHDFPVEITLYCDHAIRAARHPRGSKGHTKAQLLAVELLLAG